MITVLTWLWRQDRGRATYSAAHVNIWAAMVRRHLAMPHRLACVTDMPQGIDPDVAIIQPPREYEGIRIPSWGETKPQCFRRLAMFAPDAAERFGERFLAMDLDVVIRGPIDPIVDRPEDFVIFRGTAPSRPYNGSMLLLTAGARPQVVAQLTAEAAIAAGQRYVGSDQAWIAHVLGAGEATWGPEHGVDWWNGHGEPAASVVFFPGSVKPWSLVESGRASWVGEAYRGQAHGRCALLGPFAGLWSEVDAAWNERPFEAVITSRDVAEVWPGAVLGIAEGLSAAERLAAMYGFDDVVRCGWDRGAQ